MDKRISSRYSIKRRILKGDKVIERIIDKDGKGDDAKEVIISIKESLAKETDKKP